MAWIKSDQTLGGHPKLRRLARALRINRAQAFGHLLYLWWWALDGPPDGDLSSLTPAEIAEMAGWLGPPELFVAALRECGWLDPDGRIHEWQELARMGIDPPGVGRERCCRGPARSPPTSPRRLAL